MFENIKKLFGLKKPNLESDYETSIKDKKQLDDIIEAQIRASGKGSKLSEICLSETVNHFPQLQKLIKISSQDNDVVIHCLKGFEDPDTLKYLPCLWHHKWFIDDCKKYGTKRIVFIDELNSTFTLLNVDELDAKDWK